MCFLVVQRVPVDKAGETCHLCSEVVLIGLIASHMRGCEAKLLSLQIQMGLPKVQLFDFEVLESCFCEPIITFSVSTQVVKRISSGAFGRVYLVRAKAAGTLYALKVYSQM